jgi:hypothetical protein
MEYGVYKPKVVLAGVLAGAVLCLAAVLATTAPAAAQPNEDSVADVQYGDNIEIGDINAQVCQNIIGDINVAADQYNSGDQIAIGDGNIQAIAQQQNVSVQVVQQCINLINSSLNGDDDGNGGGDDTPAEDQYTPPDGGGGETPGPPFIVQLGGDSILAKTIPQKALANTGGFAPSAASMLLPAGALLVVSGMMMAFWIGNRRS